MAGKIRVKVRLKGDIAEVKCLVPHPMHTGSRKDPETGSLIPRHHITQLTFANNDKAVLVVNCGTAVSRDPYFSFSFRGARPGDTFSVHWVDDRGESDTAEVVIG